MFYYIGKEEKKLLLPLLIQRLLQLLLIQTRYHQWAGGTLQIYFSVSGIQCSSSVAPYYAVQFHHNYVVVTNANYFHPAYPQPWEFFEVLFYQLLVHKKTSCNCYMDEWTLEGVTYYFKIITSATNEDLLYAISVLSALNALNPTIALGNYY